jgi:hypothetical protein
VTIHVELSAEIEARLVAEARAQGTSPEKVVQQLFQEALTSHPNPPGRPSLEQFHAMLAAMAEGSEKLPNLPTESFTRESFY